MRGASQPWLVRCEDGASYVVKFQNNPQHARVLANEMLASRLAQLVGPARRRSGVCGSVRTLLGSNPQLAFEVGERREPIRPGLQFGSRFPGIPSQTLVVDFLPDRLLRRVKDLTSVFLGAFVFDKWTCNCDGRQVIFHRPADDEGSSYSVAMIDQGFCFNDGDWTFPDSPIRGIYPRRLVYEKVRGLESFEPFLSRIENLTAGELEECAAGNPHEMVRTGSRPTGAADGGPLRAAAHTCARPLLTPRIPRSIRFPIGCEEEWSLEFEVRNQEKDACRILTSVY